jgi:hypothetical protein
LRILDFGFENNFALFNPQSAIQNQSISPQQAAEYEKRIGYSFAASCGVSPVENEKRI